MNPLSTPSPRLLPLIKLGVLSLGLSYLLTGSDGALAQEPVAQGEPVGRGELVPQEELLPPEEQVLLGEQGEGELIIDGGVYNSPVVAYTENVQAWWFSTADFCEFGGQTFPPSGEGPLGTYPPGSYSATFSCTYLTPTF